MICRVELGQLENRHQDFVKRNTRLLTVSVEDINTAHATQLEYPHLIILADPEKSLVHAARVLHRRAGPGGSDIAAPTTVLLDQTGTVRWIYRPNRHLLRLSPDDLLNMIDSILDKSD